MFSQTEQMGLNILHRTTVRPLSMSSRQQCKMIGEDIQMTWKYIDSIAHAYKLRTLEILERKLLDT
jgi:hypothetical protein